MCKHKRLNQHMLHADDILTASLWRRQQPVLCHGSLKGRGVNACSAASPAVISDATSCELNSTKVLADRLVQLLVILRCPAHDMSACTPRSRACNCRPGELPL